MKKNKKLYSAYLNRWDKLTYVTYEIKEECKTHYVTEKNDVIYKPLDNKYQVTKKLALNNLKAEKCEFAELWYYDKIKKAEAEYNATIQRIRKIK